MMTVLFLFLFPSPVKVVLILGLHVYKHLVEDLYQVREVYFSTKRTSLPSLK